MKYRIRKQDELKPSGVEWLGDIPKDWEIKKLKYISEIISSNVDKKSYEGQEKVLLCNYVDVYKNDFITNKIDFMEATASESEIKKFSLQLGDILITKDSESPNDIAIPAYVNEKFENVLCGYHLAILRNNKNKVYNEYLYRFFQLIGVRNYFETMAKGVTRYGLSLDAFKNIFVPYFTIEIQQKIANFLYEKSKIFDESISKKEQLVSKLEFVKQTLISEVVTGKLKIIEQNSKLQSIKREQNELKPSKVEWLGNIPKDWQVKKLKYFTTKITSGSTPLGGSETYLDEGIPLLRSQNVHFKGLSLDNVAYISDEVHNQMKRSKLQERDVLINITGASIGRVSYVPTGFENGNVNQHVCIIRINHKVAYYKYISLLNFRT